MSLLEGVRAKLSDACMLPHLQILPLHGRARSLFLQVLAASLGARTRCQPAIYFIISLHGLFAW